MIKFILTNKDCIAIVISTISLMLSIYNFVHGILSRKCKLKIIIHTHYFNNDKTHQFFVTIQNCSQLPISISSIKINNLYPCILEPALVKENIRRSGNTVISRTETKTIPFPINLNSLESCSGYLEFRNVDHFDINDFHISFCTNRKFIKNVTIINDCPSTM